MSRCLQKLSVGLVMATIFGLGSVVRADDYAVDASHSSADFKVSHAGLSWAHGRFNDLMGSFTIDANPAKSSFTLTTKTASIDTNNPKRDEHLRSPDFFNVKQFPVITFQSTSVKAADGRLQVTGNMTMHGVTKAVTLDFAGGEKAEFPKGVQRTGYSTDFVLKRSDFGVGTVSEMLGDSVYFSLSFEGTKK